MWKQSHIHIFECPLPQDGHGWTKHDGPLELIWSCRPILPLSIVHIIETGVTEDDDDDNDDGMNDYEELLAYLNEDE